MQYSTVMYKNTMIETKQLKNYLYLYIGCQMYRASYDSMDNLSPRLLAALGEDETGNFYGYKPLLRPLGDMTEQERKEAETTMKFQRATPVHQIGSMVWTAETFKYVLSKHFDLFNLIESGLAIDKTNH